MRRDGRAAHHDRVTIPLLHIDAFTDRPFGGNPAAIALLEHPAEEGWMQSVAAEMNLSETAFVVPLEDGRFGLRWFTPAVEVPLCGHATLAAAHALWTEGRAAPDDVLRFVTASGELRATRADGRIALELPADPPVERAAPGELLDALGVRAFRAAEGRAMWLIEVVTAQEVLDAAPDFRALAAFPTTIVTAAGDGKPYDFVSRCFGPNVGIDEDPVTGSAHCLLAPWWAPRLGRTEMRAAQISARGGDLRLRLEGAVVSVAGEAVTVLRAELDV